jgi:hypothetical protein
MFLQTNGAWKVFGRDNAVMETSISLHSTMPALLAASERRLKQVWAGELFLRRDAALFPVLNTLDRVAQLSRDFRRSAQVFDRFFIV